MADPGQPVLGLAGSAALYPEKAAIVDNDGQYTYAELAKRLRAAMRVLATHGVTGKSSVLIIMSNRRQCVVAYFAALHLGATVVLLDRRAGKADLDNAVKAAGVQLLIAEPEAALAGLPGLPCLAVSEVTPDDDGPDDDGPDDAELTVPSGAGVILFTSGTSSTPKAVRHSMSSLRVGVRNMAYTLSFAADDAPFLVSPLASITGVAQMHLALERGGRLLLEDAFKTESSLLRLINLSATVFGGAPFVLEELLTEAARQECKTLPIRAIAIGGAAIPPALMELAFSRYGMVPSRVYGSSECPIAFASDPQDDRQTRLADDGCAMPGTQARLDPANGELQVRGENLFSGYLDPVHNDEAFTADGWFRTGDQATLAGGRLRITGRIKEIVSRKGLKISMAEVDALLRGMPGSLHAATYGLADNETGERLAVAIQTNEPAMVTLESVTNWLLSEGLAKWKLPEQVVLWREPLPLTASGKVLRRGLSEGGSGRLTHYAKRLQGTGSHD